MKSVSDEKPLVSICIPAYRRANEIMRLLDSIKQQDYQHIEIIVTDDTEDNSVQEVVSLFSKNLFIRYYKNSEPKGMPGNWNFALGLANGEWIKLMHDDDWFSSNKSLGIFVKKALDSGEQFVFSAFQYYSVKDGYSKRISSGTIPLWNIMRFPTLLFARNRIGPPSATMIRNRLGINFDERLKWRVDVDYYIRILQKVKSFAYVKSSLVIIGMNESQVTNSCINNPQVEIPEGNYFLLKYGSASLWFIQIYDTWWRMLRNMKIYSRKDLLFYDSKNWPKIIDTMVIHLSWFAGPLLNFGFTSKLFMLISYCVNWLTNRRKA